MTLDLSQARPEAAAAFGNGKQAGRGTLDLLLDIELPLVVRFGKAKMTLGDLAALRPGSNVDLECAPNHAVDLLINGRAVARGVAVSVDGKYGVRVTEIISKLPPNGAMKRES